ncbi:phosphoribosyltransferase family protein, partial [Soonwooa sp.]|uniref:phosphoribosyltransferase n=1 Tax=Soonwooa sp. TaxID=1938592 RepID=UPI002898B4B1
KMSSYVGTESSGIVFKEMELTKDIKDRHIILMEDIVDTGNTIENLFTYFKETQRPKSIKVASLLLKPDVYKKEFKIDYLGKEIPNKFVLGYGLDYDELGRNLKDLYQLEDGSINH